jgi:micrococcal nuclease
LVVLTLTPAPGRAGTAGGGDVVTKTLLLVLAAVAAGCALQAAPGQDGDRLEGDVVRVVDGDTIHMRLGDRREKVRYIGVDTPEGSGEPAECFGRAATAFNHRLVAGRRVRLVIDVQERDRYGRLLAYVYAGERFVNAEVVDEGYARPLTIAPNVRFAERFARLPRAEVSARLSTVGRCSVASSPRRS